MKIVVLVKQVPHPEAIEFDEQTKALKREGVPLFLNPFDRRAVLEAVRLRETGGGEVVTMTMGPPQAEEALRETIALGADRAVHLTDRVFAVADTLGTSRTLSLAIAKEGADLVLCGRKTVDSETWQVPPEVAAFLDWPQLTMALELALQDGRLRARRETDVGDETYEIDLPAVVSTALASDDAAEPAPQGRVDVWTASDLVSDLQPNDKRFGQPGSPTRVLAVRDVTPERAGATVAPDEAPERVRTLLAERAPATPSWDKPGHIAEQPAARYDSWSVVELRDGRPTRLSLELVGKSRELAGKLGGTNVALVAGPGARAAAGEAARHGAERLHVVEHPALEAYDADVWAAALGSVVERERPHVLLIPASVRGRDYGPRLAGELQLGMTGDCVNVDIAKAGRLLQTKPAYGGNIVSMIMGTTTPQVASVRTRMFQPLESRDDARAEIVDESVDALPAARTRVLEQKPSPTAAHELDEADVVVLVGDGAAGELDEIERAARELGAAVGMTRAICTRGLRPTSRHVGLYGRPVAPRLLVTVGVPGDFEERTGFVKAAVIVAIGSPAGSPMRAGADVVVDGDTRALLAALVRAVTPLP